MIDRPTPIFVVGSPRSGTTMMAAYLASEPSVINLGEFAAVYFTSYHAEREYKSVPTIYVAKIVETLQAAAANLAQQIAEEQGAKYFVESTPWNLRIISTLCSHYPKAQFILMLRHYRGAIQSMERSSAVVYRWAGPDDATRAQTWASLYTLALDLPHDRTVAVSYDRLCTDPRSALHDLKQRLALHGLPNDHLLADALMVSHATSCPRPVLCSLSDEGEIEFHGRASYDASSWTAQREIETAVVCARVWERLVALYGYCQPVNAQ